MMRSPRCSASSDAAVVNSINAYRIEGQKCAAFAILEARAWARAGLDRAARRQSRQHLGDRQRLSRSARARADRSLAAPRTRARGTRRRTRPRARSPSANRNRCGRALRALEQFNGIELAVDDDAILEAKAQIGREGIGCEPASAASLAGLRALRASGELAPDADVVAILTGHVLKDARSPSTTALRAYARDDKDEARGDKHAVA